MLSNWDGCQAREDGCEEARLKMSTTKKQSRIGQALGALLDGAVQLGTALYGKHTASKAQKEETDPGLQALCQCILLRHFSLAS